MYRDSFSVTFVYEYAYAVSLAGSMYWRNSCGFYEKKEKRYKPIKIEFVVLMNSVDLRSLHYVASLENAVARSNGAFRGCKPSSSGCRTLC